MGHRAYKPDTSSAEPLLPAVTEKADRNAASTAPPLRQSPYANYETACAEERYAAVARHLGLPGVSDAELCDSLIERLTEMASQLGLPSRFKDTGISEEEYKASARLLAENAFDDQCTLANPVFPSMQELEKIILDAW